MFSSRAKISCTHIVIWAGIWPQMKFLNSAARIHHWKSEVLSHVSRGFWASKVLEKRKREDKLHIVRCWASWNDTRTVFLFKIKKNFKLWFLALSPLLPNSKEFLIKFHFWHFSSSFASRSLIVLFRPSICNAADKCCRQRWLIPHRCP